MQKATTLDGSVIKHPIGVADPENSLLPIDGAVIIVTEQLMEVWSKSILV